MSKTKNTLPIGDWLKDAIRSSAVTVGTSATMLPATALSDRRSIAVYNNSSVTVYLGHSGVTIENGFPLAPETVFAITLDEAIGLYAVAGSAGNNVRVFEGA